jgi:predicted house-cleaning noncanonical NTP pyrophosphatase (MazG superfamily)
VKYGKAIRDSIPEIIRESGANCTVEILPNDAFLLEMEKKLGEEVDEYLQSKSPEELADLLEVIHRIIELRGITMEELEIMRLDKSEKRGGFTKNLYLVETTL